MIDIHEKLLLIFANVNEWLKFAEAKIAALFAANAAAIFASAQLLMSEHPPKGLWMVYTIEFIGCSVVALVLCLMSFLPIREISELGKAKVPAQENLFFYAHIASNAPDVYLLKVRAAYGPNVSAHAPIDLDLSTQVVANSRITVRKYAFFVAAGFITLMGIITIPATVVLFMGLTIYRKMVK